MSQTTTKTVLSRILFVLYIAAICLICFASSDSLPNIRRTLFGLDTDKVIHFIMFAPFPILAYLSFDHNTRKKGARILFVVISLIAGTAVALMTEALQFYIPSRTMDIKDFYADIMALGIVSVFVLAIDLTHKR